MELQNCLFSLLLILCLSQYTLCATTKPIKMASITYSSTRGGQSNLDFRTVVMTGLAHDRGLFVPDTFPTVEPEELESWRGLDYPGLAIKVISKFVKEDQVPAEKLEDIVRRSCAAFRHEDVTPVISVGGHKVLVSRIFSNVLADMNQIFKSYVLFEFQHLANTCHDIIQNNRNFSMDLPLRSKMLLFKCLVTFSNISWKRDPTVDDLQFLEQHPEILDQLRSMGFEERRELIVSFFSRRTEFHPSKNIK